MDYYHIWCDLREGASDIELATALAEYLNHLRDQGAIVGWGLRRRKLGFGPDALGEFHVEIAVRDLAQLEAAFQQVVPRRGEIERLHAAVYARIVNSRFALERDFPDAGRRTV
ncbi:MAG: hypothetical protein K1X74_20195 [Pirellulales bacterium]|nr:hypothetical protein [Pirellulales bacterium]